MLVCSALGFLAAASASAADGPSQTVSAVGGAAVKVVRPAHKSDASIRKAVDAAREKVYPAAVASARQEAQRLASALGVQLGALQTVAEQSNFPFGPSNVAGLDGTFPNGKFCGTVRVAVFKQTKDGRRPIPGKFRKHFGCRVPPSVTLTVTATFLVS